MTDTASRVDIDSHSQCDSAGEAGYCKFLYQNTSAKPSKRHPIYTYQRNPLQSKVDLCVHIRRTIHLFVLAILTSIILRKCQTFPSTQRFVVTCYCGLIDENATAFLIGALVSKHNAHWLWHRAFKDIRHRKFRPYPRIHIANRYFLMSAESFFGSIFGFSLDISSLSDAVC